MMNSTSKTIAILMAAMIVVASVLMFAIPTHSGEIRQDLREGDYVMQESNTLDMEKIIEKLYISGFDEDGNLIVLDQMNPEKSPVIMTKERFIGMVLFDNDNCESMGYAEIHNNYGYRFCTVYEKGDYQYWVGEHQIIYKYMLHGMSWKLVETSLIID